MKWCKRYHTLEVNVMKTRKNAFAAIALAAVMLFSGCNGVENSAQTQESSASAAETPEVSVAEESNEMTALEATRLMGNGINLGNTMEAYGHKSYLTGSDPTSFEGLWGQPTTTREMIEGMKTAGFDSLRIPVAWTNGMNYESGNYTIDARLLERVKTIVDYALDCDMYVVINDHWDGSWWGMFGSADESTREKAMEMYKAMWSQIADYFGDCSYKLIFESANEELGDRLNDKDVATDSGTLSKAECYETTNLINSEFVKLIRSTGGKNADRFLLIAGYNTDITCTCDDRFVMPEDTAKDKLIVSVHYYTPWDYCGTKSVNQWGSPQDYDEQNNLLQKMTKFTEKGYGVIIGEYAVLVDGSNPKPDTDLFYNNFLNNCDLYNYCPMLWDCNNLYRRNSGFISDESMSKLFKERSFSEQSALSEAEIKENAEKEMAQALEAAKERMTDENDIAASDDAAVAWIMYQSSDYGVSYSVGDVYDPTNKTVGVKATNALITGEGTYTIGLDFSEINGAKGVAFSAIGISNGETLYPGYIITIDSFTVNGEECELVGKAYTSSDDGKCTRVNLFNQWVSSVPEDARTADGSLDGASAQIWQINKKKNIENISITITVSAPKE